MRFSAILPILAVLFVTGAAQAVPPPAASPAVSSTPGFLLGATATCNSSRLPLDLNGPPRASAATLCGSCSDQFCQGHSGGQTCFSFGHQGRCQWDVRCSSGAPACYCGGILF